ncbi:IPT/TIG domain-containing protein [Variovorax sp. YR216]|uniref:IPT/TIG domain-containing protein n=1 Tax=Variovorax sp. YR216 TaxID=1882828 RepID=UPI0015A1DE13|nr:IPT/TIG domain-containing protein [Variovorax sp. YR216]
MAIPLALLFALPSSAQVPVLQRGYDPGVTGANLSETVLNAANVNSSNFGMLFKLPVDDVIYAQPLYVPGLTIANQGVHNVLYVATMSDSLYAFDADIAGAPLWTVNLATSVGATPVPIANFTFSGNRNITGNLGILSTPVIDRSTNTMYLIACTLESNTMVYRLHAIDITSGALRPGSGVKIIATYGGSTFDGRYQTQRVSLVLSGNQVVFGFGAVELEYSGGYVGWMMAYDKTTLAQSGVFATVTTGNRGGGVWQSGRPPVVDSAGFVYAFVGNAYGSGYDGVNNFSESVLKLDPSNGLRLVDWFTPGNWSSLDNQDLDLTSSGPLLIPGTGLLAGGGKTGDLYVLDTSNLGKYNATDSQVVQKQNISASEFRGGPVYWQRSAANGGPLLYNWGVNDRLKAYPFNGRTFAANPSAQGSATNQIFPGGLLTLSANGDTPGSGVLWATTAAGGDAENNPPVGGVLHAYDAGNVANELWNTTLNAASDGFGNLAKFVPPLVVNGKVYQASWSSQVAVYGLKSTFPSLKNVAPGTGSAGTTVTLQGGGFAPGASVAFGGVAATNVVFSSSTRLTATVPAHAAGAVDVVVTNADGHSATLQSGFTYKKLH